MKNRTALSASDKAQIEHLQQHWHHIIGMASPLSDHSLNADLQAILTGQAGTPGAAANTLHRLVTRLAEVGAPAQLQAVASDALSRASSTKQPHQLA